MPKNFYFVYTIMNEVKNKLNKEIESHRSKNFINLASEEYYKSIKGQLLETVVTPIFQERKGSQFKVIGINAKRARGLMTRFIIKNKITHYGEIYRIISFNYFINQNV